jgi:hypothetical protein
VARAGVHRARDRRGEVVAEAVEILVVGVGHRHPEHGSAGAAVSLPAAQTPPQDGGTGTTRVCARLPSPGRPLILQNEKRPERKSTSAR